MTVVVVALIILAGLSGNLGIYFLVSRSWLRRRVQDRVIVHCLPPSDQSVEGLLTLVARDGLILQGARFLEANAPAAGEVFIPRDRIGFVQYQP